MSKNIVGEALHIDGAGSGESQIKSLCKFHGKLHTAALL